MSTTIIICGIISTGKISDFFFQYRVFKFQKMLSAPVMIRSNLKRLLKVKGFFLYKKFNRQAISIA